MNPHPMLALSEEVAAGIRGGAALVALESTIISHGMPYPRNVEMALEVEGIIRDAGAVPATIAVLDGVPRIGLSRDELETLAQALLEFETLSGDEIKTLLAGGKIDRGTSSQPTIPSAGSSIPKAKRPKPGIGGAAPAGA